MSQSPTNRYAVVSIQMDTSEYKIVYYDRENHYHKHTVEGFTSVIPREFFDEMGPRWDHLIDLLRQPKPVQAVGEPYPETLIETDIDPA